MRLHLRHGAYRSDRDTYVHAISIGRGRLAGALQHIVRYRPVGPRDSPRDVIARQRSTKGGVPYSAHDNNVRHIDTTNRKQQHTITTRFFTIHLVPTRLPVLDWPTLHDTGDVWRISTESDSIPVRNWRRRSIHPLHDQYCVIAVSMALPA